MWSGFDPALHRDLQNMREMVSLTHRTPTREWPLLFSAEHNELLVVREWPNGSITAYLTSAHADRIRNER